MDWDSIAKLSREAFRTAVNEWIGKARFQGGKVSGSSAVLTPGSLSSDTNIELRVVQILTNSQVPREVSAPLAKVLAAAWTDWANGFQVQIPHAYPSFRAFPGPRAPLTPAAGATALSDGSSAGEASLKSQTLAAKLGSSLRLRAVKGGNSPDAAMKSLAAWVESSFTEWKGLVHIAGLLGEGSVPTFAPPYVPVGPVVSGENRSAGSPFVGPRFGKVVL